VLALHYFFSPNPVPSTPTSQPTRNCKANTMSLSSNEVVLEGWLTKQGGSRGGRRNWKIRFFQLSNKHLLYFKNNKSLGSPLGEFVCDDLTAVAVSNTAMKDAFLFDLIYPTRTVRVYAASEEDRKNWIDGINQPSEYSGPSSTATERPSRSRIMSRTIPNHKRAQSEGTRSRSRTLPQRVATGGAAKCESCGKTAYSLESITCDGVTYHKRCFRCKECNNKLSVGGYAMIHGDAYCKPHFKQLFQASGGKYDRAFGSIYTNSSDPLAKIITKASTDVVQHSSSVDSEGPAVADDSDSEGLSDGEMASRDRLAVERKSRVEDQFTITAASRKELEKADATREKRESSLQEESLPNTSSVLEGDSGTSKSVQSVIAGFNASATQ